MLVRNDVFGIDTANYRELKLGYLLYLGSQKL
jgi:hypothetical protein